MKPVIALEQLSDRDLDALLRATTGRAHEQLAAEKLRRGDYTDADWEKMWDQERMWWETHGPYGL